MGDSITIQIIISRFEWIEKLFPRQTVVHKKFKLIGGEFTARIIRYLNSLGIKFFTTFNEETKASVAEKFIRTNMSENSRYITFNNTYRYLDALPKLVESYNNTYHRTIRTTPNNVTEANEKQIWSLIYEDSRTTVSFQI